MGWMEARAPQRSDPRLLWPDVRSIIMLGLSYAPKVDPLRHAARGDVGVVSVYAHGRDYHDVIKRKLKTLARAIVEASHADVKLFVDTAPVMEKPLAQAAGIGWQGKHSNLVSRADGSWLFLASIYTTLALEPDAPHADRCGSCTACQAACPTDAFPMPYVVDARRCISYLTIEHKGPIPHAFRAAMGNRIYGCDDCLAVCPWNKFAQDAHEIAFTPRLELLDPALGELVWLEDAEFRALFSGSPVKRIGRDRFVRNVLIAIGNSGDAAMIDGVIARLQDESALVRGAAVWAASQLMDGQAFAALRVAYVASETDAEVQAEWALSA